MKKLKDWLSDFFDFSYREIEEENLKKIDVIGRRCTEPYPQCLAYRDTKHPTYEEKLSRMDDIIFAHVHLSSSQIENYKWKKLYSIFWQKFDMAQRKISSIYDMCSEDFDAEKYCDALRKYVKEHESELDKQSFAERIKAIFSATVRAYF